MLTDLGTEEGPSLVGGKMTFREWVGKRMTVTAPQTDDQKNQIPSERSVLSDKMLRFVLLHFRGLEASDLQDYTFERHKTEYPDAKADLDIFDSTGRLVFQGREFGSGMAGYWRPSRVSMVPQWASNEESWGRPGQVPNSNSLELSVDRDSRSQERAFASMTYWAQARTQKD